MVPLGGLINNCKQMKGIKIQLKLLKRVQMNDTVLNARSIESLRNQIFSYDNCNFFLKYFHHCDLEMFYCLFYLCIYTNWLLWNTILAWVVWDWWRKFSWKKLPALLAVIRRVIINTGRQFSINEHYTGNFGSGMCISAASNSYKESHRNVIVVDTNGML